MRVETGFLIQTISDQFAVEHRTVIQTRQVRADRRRFAAAPVVTDEQQRLIDAVAQQVVFFSLDDSGVRATGSGRASGWNTMSP